jgi:hypothetical protein
MAPTTLEQHVIDAWKGLPYHGFGICANPDCGRPAYCCGKNPLSRVCLVCFEFAYDMTAPTHVRRMH